MKKALFIILTFVFVVCLFGQIATPPSAGDGTEGNPYQISSLENLYWITTTESSWNQHFIQTANINASETANWNDVDTDVTIHEGWLPIDDFRGTYDGGNHTITGLTANRPDTDKQSFIGSASWGTIKNLGIIGGTMIGDSDVGGLAGVIYDTSVVENCYSTANVLGTYNNVGGLIGEVYGSTVTNCYATGNVRGDHLVAGLVGYSNTNSSIQNCYATGNIRSHSKAGGFVGHNTDSLIKNCYATGNVTRDSSSTDLWYGGFAAYMYNGRIINCYSTGSVHYLGMDDPTDRGFIGYVVTGSEHEMTSNYWDVTTSDQTSSFGEPGAYAAGKTTTEMKQQATFLNWDFTNIWNITENGSYPFLRTVGVANHDISIPAMQSDIILHSAYPNPFNANSQTQIEYVIKSNVKSDLIIYNVRGQIVKSYHNLQNGMHTINWNSNDENNIPCAAGVYFYQLKNQTNSVTKKLVLIK